MAKPDEATQVAKILLFKKLILLGAGPSSFSLHSNFFGQSSLSIFQNLIIYFYHSMAKPAEALAKAGVPKGSRTPVSAVKGRCPRPLDDRDV